MSDEIYDAFKKRESLLDEKCKKFNTTDQMRCPFCGCERPHMYWKFDDYDVWYIIECTNFDCRIKSYQSPEDCINQWNRRDGK